jgi:hypothetical protein
MANVRLLCGALLVSSLALLGCSKGNPNAPARISGSLTYNGQPIKSGVMQLYTPDGVAYAAQISSDGTYSATDIPTGELIITVETESTKPAKTYKGTEAAGRMQQMKQVGRRPGGGDGGGTAEPPPVHYIKIPAMYSNPKTSPLTVDVKAGRQVHNIELTD